MRQSECNVLSLSDLQKNDQFDLCKDISCLFLASVYYTVRHGVYECLCSGFNIFLAIWAYVPSYGL